MKEVNKMKTMTCTVNFNGIKVKTCKSFKHEAYGTLWKDEKGNTYMLKHARRSNKYAFIPVEVR